MKKLLFGMAFMGAMMFTGLSLEAKAGEPLPGEEGFDCKVELFVCSIWTGSTRQVCHQNGSGLSCICGESTTCD